jgi:hypothetical protein
MRGVADALRSTEPSLNPVSAEIALGVVGGVNELVMATIEARGVEAITGLGDAATGLWAGMLTGAAVPAPARSAV